MATFVTENGSISSSGAAAAFPITPSGIDTVLYVVAGHFGNTSDVSAVTHNSLPLTKIGAIDWDGAGAGGRISVWRRVNPSGIAANVAVTFPGISESSIAAVVYSGVNQRTPERALATQPNVSGNSTTNATTIAGDTVLGATTYDAANTLTSSTGTIRSNHFAFGFDGTGIIDQIAVSASTGVNITVTGGAHGDFAWALIDSVPVFHPPRMPLGV
jgi:hypothetical protein